MTPAADIAGLRDRLAALPKSTRDTHGYLVARLLDLAQTKRDAIGSFELEVRLAACFILIDMERWSTSPMSSAVAEPA